MPSVLPTFFETSAFTREWARLGLDVESDLLALQLAIAAHPLAAPVIPGTGGLRKLRFAPPNWPGGKRGGLRVCYASFADHRVVLLVVVYDKHRREDLPAAAKAEISRLLQSFERELTARRRRHEP